MDYFGSRPIKQPDPLPLGRPILDTYLPTRSSASIWVDLLLPISSSVFWVSLFRVAFRYATVKYKVLTLVHRRLFWMYWPPWWSKQTGTHTLPHPKNECQWSINDCWSCILGNLEAYRMHVVVNIVLAAFLENGESWMLPTPSWKWASMGCQRFLLLLSQ